MPAVGRKRAGLALLCPRAESFPHIGVKRENGPFWAGSRAGRPCLGAAQAVYGPGNWITLDPSRFGARHRSAESWHPAAQHVVAAEPLRGVEIDSGATVVAARHPAPSIRFLCAAALGCGPIARGGYPRSARGNGSGPAGEQPPRDTRAAVTDGCQGRLREGPPLLELGVPHGGGGVSLYRLGGAGCGDPHVPGVRSPAIAWFQVVQANRPNSQEGAVLARMVARWEAPRRVSGGPAGLRPGNSRLRVRVTGCRKGIQATVAADRTRASS